MENDIPTEDTFRQMMEADEAMHNRVHNLIWRAIRQFVGEHPTDAEYVVILETIDEIVEEIERAIGEVGHGTAGRGEAGLDKEHTSIMNDAGVLILHSTAGSQRDLARDAREQPWWDEHAAFIDGLVAEGFIQLGGPLNKERRRRALRCSSS